MSDNTNQHLSEIFIYSVVTSISSSFIFSKLLFILSGRSTFTDN